ALAHGAVVLEAAGDAAHALRRLGHRQAEAAQPGEQFALACRERRAFDHAEPVEERAQRPRRSDLRVQLPQAAGGSITRVDEYLLAARAGLLVHALETLHGHEHLAAYLEQ